KRRDEALTTRSIMEYMLQLELAWVTNDMADKRSGLLALQLMCERPANRHDFTSQKPQTAKKSREDLEQTRAEFALDFWRTYAEAVSNDEVYIGGLTIRERNRSTFILVSFIGHIAHSLGNMVVQVVVGQLRLRIVVDKILNRT
ncbi:hypothetical protein PC113_g15990, partial [Phytophthora cactorum]